jgi:MSHA biogenesis protein MshE
MAIQRPKKIRLGDLLVEKEAITEEQLLTALDAQKSTGNKLGRELIESGYITEDQLLDILARQLNIEFIDINNYAITPEIVKKIPEVQARRFRALALAEEPDHILIGMADPTNIFAYDEISRLVGKPINMAVIKEDDLLKILDSVYRRTADINNFAAELGQQISSVESATTNQTVNEGVADAPVVKLLQTMLEDAVQVNASDIHIEPDINELRIRFRIDGTLRIQSTTDHRIAGALISRLKLMSGLDISEKRLPQDGRFHLNIRDHRIDVRLSTLPLPDGEAAVMRLLNQSAGILSVDQLGMPDELTTKVRKIARSPHGLMLVTGPTGSGKTTTLYALLSELNDPEVKIITIEDPVEYRLSGVNQVQVNPKVELTFSKVLRSVLRQDPDIVLIGEMRDKETIEIGLRASMTGHFVMSTLHTNDAISSALRLIDMGAEPYLIAGALRGILAQRLVRRVCASCTVNDTLDAATKLILEDMNEEAKDVTFKRGSGCRACNNTGFQGRIGIYEFLEMDADLIEILHGGDLMGFSKMARSRPNFKPLRQSAFELAVKGVTTVDEVLKVNYGMEI